ncbi:ead/Ea22-like family protein [Escherichia coli]|nr:ead/Ea22-like family protein [Escherichia coli]
MSEINSQALREAAEQAMHDDWGFDADLFHELVTPSIVLELLDERERNQQYIKRRDQENEEIALTVGKLRVELEAAEALNKHLELAIRKADGCSDALRRKTEAAEKRIAELEAREVVLPQCYSMLHRVDFDEPYHTEMVYRQHQVLEALHNAGINVTEACKGEAS